MINRIFKNKSFLDISKAEMISKSIVFVDKNAKTISSLKPTGIPQNIQLENKFGQLSNLLLLKTIMGKDGFQAPSTNPISQDFIFNDFVIQNTIFPPKFTIKHNTSDKKVLKINDIANKIVEVGNLSEIVDGIGLNYELFYNNEDSKIDLKGQICKDDISSQFEKAYFRLEKHIGSTKLVLTLSDATIEGKKAVYILANFHNEISTTNTLEKILKENFLSTLEEIVENIFENNEK
jgi:hypothetical protein